MLILPVHFFVVVPSYHNKKYCIENLESVVRQTYKNWSMIIIVDGLIEEDDGTGDMLEAYVTSHGLEEKVIIKRNNARLLALHNIYDAITHYCPDDYAVVVLLDGDDWLHDKFVFERLNRIYTRYNVFLTHGQFCIYPGGKKSDCTAIPAYYVKNNMFRDYRHMPTHLRTFYAWLFKNIDLEDLLLDGQFFKMTGDQAIMYPMIEMAGERHAFIPDILYVYNCENELNDYKVDVELQHRLSRIIKSKKRYSRLDNEITRTFDDKPLYKNNNKNSKNKRKHNKR